MPYSLVFDCTDVASANKFAGDLMGGKKGGHFLSKGKREVFNSVEDMLKKTPKWNWYYSEPEWILCGQPKNIALDVDDQKLFINDCHAGDYDYQNEKLMASYGWAIFPYFKSYRSDDITFICQDKALFEEVVKKMSVLNPKMVVEVYDQESTSLKTLRNMSFNDYDEEGKYILQLAQNMNEVPVLLCDIEKEGENVAYGTWDEDYENYDPTPWYQNSLSKLKLIQKVPHKDGESWLLEVNDPDACLHLWSRSSYDNGIASALFSPDCKVDTLVERLKQSGCYYSEDILKGLASWEYFQLYGGGSDEHHAVFRANDPTLTHQLWEWVKTSKSDGTFPISRF